MRPQPSHSSDDAPRRHAEGRPARRGRRCCARARLLGRAHCPACGQPCGDGTAARALDAVIRRWEQERMQTLLGEEARLARVIRRLLRRGQSLALDDLAALLGIPAGTLKPIIVRQIALGAIARAGALAARPNRARLLVRLAV